MHTVSKRSWLRPALGVLAAIGIIIGMIVSGLPEELLAFSLIPLVGLYWLLGRFSRAEMGFVRGPVRDYGLAVLYPVLLLSLVGLTAWLSGATNIQDTDWAKLAFNTVSVMVVTILLAIITEEGFFRGWLWASLRRAGLNPFLLTALTSLAIAAWHLPIAVLTTAFTLPLAQVPLYMLNIVITGTIMSLFRLKSGSVVVPSVSHGIWNAITYAFFGTGVQAGLLGIQETAIFGAEVGIVGLGLNLVFAIGLWLRYGRAGTTAAGGHAGHSAPARQPEAV